MGNSPCTHVVHLTLLVFLYISFFAKAKRQTNNALVVKCVRNVSVEQKKVHTKNGKSGQEFEAAFVDVVDAWLVLKLNSEKCMLMEIS